MVSLTAHFTLLSAILSLALTSVNGLVIPTNRPMAAVVGRHVKDHERADISVLLLPKGSKSVKSRRSEKDAEPKIKQLKRGFYGDYNNPLHQIAGALVGGGDPYYDVHANPLLDVFVSSRQQKPFEIPHRKRNAEGVSGIIDIMSKNGDTEKRIASLFLEIDDSTGTPTYAFGASDTNSTQLMLVPDADSPEPSDAVVSLQIPMFDRQTASEVYYCITYDPNPPKPEPFGLAQCVNGTLPNSQSSQSFAYDGSTGNIEPMWLNHSAASTDSASVTTRDSSDSQNMILKFQPLEPLAPVSVKSVEDDPSVETTTTTSTITVTMTSSSGSAAATDTAVKYFTAASPSASPSSTDSATAREGALAVEFVSNSSVMPTQTVSSSSAAASPTSTADADAVAQSIADSNTTADSGSSSASSSPTATNTETGTPTLTATPTSAA